MLILRDSKLPPESSQVYVLTKLMSLLTLINCVALVPPEMDLSKNKKGETQNSEYMNQCLISIPLQYKLSSTEFMFLEIYHQISQILLIEVSKAKPRGKVLGRTPSSLDRSPKSVCNGGDALKLIINYPGKYVCDTEEPG